MLTFATSSKTVYVFYLKWVHSPAEPAHSLQNQDIIWFLQYNVIHSPTSLSVIVQLYEYNFSSHLFFFKNVTEIFSDLDKFDKFKADGKYGICVAFSIWIFFTKDDFNVYSCCKMCESCILFFFCTVIKNK